MPTDLFTQMMFYDGEGIVAQDFLDAQRNLDAKLMDQFIHQMTPDPFGSSVETPSVSVSTGFPYAFCPNPASAYIQQQGSANQVGFAPGTLYQRIASPISGSDATLIGYTFSGTSTTERFTIGAGSGANPRVDLLQIKLEYITDTSTIRDFEDAATRVLTSNSVNKRRRVQCTLSVKVGTPAASPEIPQQDTGFCAVGYVVVGANYATGTTLVVGQDQSANTAAVVCDLRIPLSVKPYTYWGFKFAAATNVTNFTLAQVATATNAANQLNVFLDVPYTSRIMTIGIVGTSAAVPVAKFQRVNGGVAASTQDAASFIFPPAGPLVNTAQGLVAPLQFSMLGLGPIVQPSSGGLGFPLHPCVWGNGMRSPFPSGAGLIANQKTYYGLNCQIGNITNGGTIEKIVVWAAGGL